MSPGEGTTVLLSWGPCVRGTQVESSEALFSGSGARVTHLLIEVTSPRGYLMEKPDDSRPCSDYCKSLPLCIVFCSVDRRQWFRSVVDVVSF